MAVSVIGWQPIAPGAARQSPASVISSRWIITARPGAPENAFDIATSLRPMRRTRVHRVIGDEAAADLGAVGIADHDAVAARELALDRRDAGRQQALALASGPRRRRHRRPARAPRLERAGDPDLARGDGIGRRQEPGAGRAVRRCAPGDGTLPGGDHHMRARGGGDRPASILVRMPPRDSSDAAPPAMASISGVMRGTTGISVAAGIVLRRRRIEPVDVGKQHEADRRRPWWRRAPRAGHCRRSGFRLVATVSFSLTTGTARSASSGRCVARALR
jgi:hypothetical protein